MFGKGRSKSGRGAIHCARFFPASEKKKIAQKACDGYCHWEEPVDYVAQIQNRYDHCMQGCPAAMTERRHGL
jgi:hypothetical protein